jgi:lysophospholipase II
MIPAHIQYGPLSGHPHSHTIILLHGRSSTGTEFANDFFESEASIKPGTPRQDLRNLFPTVRWVFPSAPDRYSLRFRETMPQWFDMWSTEEPQDRPEQQVEGIRQSVEAIIRVVQEQEQHVPRGMIVLGGISQGFAAVVAALSALGPELGGLMGFCSWVPSTAVTELADNHVMSSHDPEVQATPVFLAHSADDNVVPIAQGEQLRDYLVRMGPEVDWHRYEDGEHWINEPQGIDDMAAFLSRRIMSNIEEDKAKLPL